MSALELDGLTKEYGEVVANDGVTFDVERGEIFGYLGPNGAGKTTTIRTLLGFISPTAGSARVLGADVTDERALVEVKRRIGYLPDDPQFDETATGREVLDLHAGIKGDERSAELLELFDPPLDRQVREYSHGNVRKLGLVTTFMHDPDLVILDEPTGGLDPLMKQRFAEFVRAERDRGLTVFFSSHILGEVRRLCDRVGIIRNGDLVTVEPVESLLERSGTVVRLVAAEPIPRRVFATELSGVHDLATGASAAGPTADEARTANEEPTNGEEPATDEARTSGGAAAESDGDGSGGTESEPTDVAYREYTFTFTGDVDALLATLGDHSLVDCTIEEAPLESVFLRFYGGEGDA